MDGAGAQRAWHLLEADEARVRDITRATGLSPLVARMLTHRGVTDAASAHAFIAPDLDSHWLDPMLLPSMEEAAARVARAIADGERIVIFGDFDLDGVSSAALATLGLRALGGDVSAVVPHRFREGYGLTDASVARVLSDPPDLLVTVDCGVSAAAEVAALQSAGVSVIVTDHHEPGGSVPRDVPVVDPKFCEDPGCSADLAGAGVALKLVQAVGGVLGNGGAAVWRGLTDLAALGTIGDIVPLLGENRALVADGLESLRARPRVAIEALCAVAGVSADGLTADQVAFALAPRLNAAGRMSDPEVALALLLESDAGRAEELARALDGHNSLRQRIEQDLQLAAEEQARNVYTPGDRLLMLSGEGWHEGVKGIVASRMAGAYSVPTILFSLEDGVAHGSGRTAGSVDLFELVSPCADMLTRFGGHAAAVGLTLPEDDLPRLGECLRRRLADLPDEAFRVEMRLDAEVALEDVGLELAAELALLEPHGHANPRPLLGVHGVFMGDRKRVGRDRRHLRFTAFDGAAAVPAIAFRCRDIERMSEHETAVDLAVEVAADEWRGRQRVQLNVRDLLVHERPVDAPAAELVDDLFEHADEVLAAGEYAGIGDAASFHTKLAGVTFEGRQEVVRRLTAGVPLRLERQPENAHDANACALYDAAGDQVGFFNRRLAAALAPLIDAGVAYEVEVSDVTGGEDGRSLGVNVLVSRRAAETDVAEEETRAERREELAALSAQERESALARALIGERELYEAQRRSLDLLADGRSVLTVMATGRGKSLVFHVDAARRALAEGRSSVFVFPLRALVSDQAFHLSRTLGGLGLVVRTVTGESSPAERDDVFGALAAGGADVLLTTPEFLDRHAARFAAAGRVGLVVVDEAHHVAGPAGHRPAYRRLGEALGTLGDPAVFACTATCSDEVAEAIRETLGVGTIVTDPTVRENLRLADRRAAFARNDDKDAYLASIAARGDKVVIYVNSREQTVRIARSLRSKVPSLGHAVAYYNGGLTRPARHAVEGAFRRGDICAVVATSAFGEGVNVPDIRHVALYHMPFNDVEFNQMSGRAGRDGQPAHVHLLFGERDARLNETILAQSAPEPDDMRRLYVALREMQAASEEGAVEATNAELAEKARRRGARGLTERGVSAALGVFRELGLAVSEGAGSYRRLTLADDPERVDLADSVRFAEGRREIEGFAEFKEWVLTAPAQRLLERFNRPILPTQAELPPAEARGRAAHGRWEAHACPRPSNRSSPS